MLGLCAAMAFAAPRFLVALGEDGQLYAGVAAWSGRSETPRVAIAIGTVLGALLALTLDFRALVDFTSVTLLVQYVAACVAVVVLRRRWPKRPRTWRMPLSPALPVVGALLLCGVLLQSDWQQMAAAGLLIAVGFVFRWGRHAR
jgi:APA family basic amino acid/polyamine antiporter